MPFSGARMGDLRAVSVNAVPPSSAMLAACFIVDLPELGGAEKIRKLGVPVRTLVTFEGH